MMTHVLNAQLIVYWITLNIVFPAHMNKYIQLALFTKGIRAPGCWRGIIWCERILRKNCWLVSKHFSKICLIIQYFQFTKITDFNGINVLKRKLVLEVPLGVLVGGFWVDPVFWLLTVPAISDIENNCDCPPKRLDTPPDFLADFWLFVFSGELISSTLLVTV